MLVKQGEKNKLFSILPAFLFGVIIFRNDDLFKTYRSLNW